MRTTPVLHLRLAARLREHAAEARALGARLAGAELEGHAITVERDLDAIRSVARALAEKVTRFAGQEAKYPIARVWAAAAEIAARPQDLRRAPLAPQGLAALPVEKRRAIQAAGRQAWAARLPEERCRASQKAAQTSRSRGKTRQGERHPASVLTDAQVAEIRRLWANGSGPSHATLAKQFGVSRELVGKIVRGQLRKAPATRRPT